jgi:HAD superfamily hydrolase (TIGR01509 family)
MCGYLLGLTYRTERTEVEILIDLTTYRFAALIFDCDGTLVNTPPLHFRSLKHAFASQGLEIAESWYRDRVGLSRTPLFEAFERDFGVTIDYRAAETVSESTFASIVNEVQEIPQVASIAREHHLKVPMAVASGAQRFLAEAALKASGLFELFDTIVTVDDVREGKPSPALFLEAAKRLLMDSAQCLVFEDTDEGLEAARRANMQAVDVRPLKANLHIGEEFRR